MKKMLGWILVALLVLSVSAVVMADPQNGGDLPFIYPNTTKL